MKMYDKWMEAHPRDIVWNNLDDGALEMKTRYMLSWAATVGLIIAWSFPVAFIGTLSNLTELCTNIKWLAWVCNAPKVLIRQSWSRGNGEHDDIQLLLEVPCKHVRPFYAILCRIVSGSVSDTCLCGPVIEKRKRGSIRHAQSHLPHACEGPIRLG